MAGPFTRVLICEYGADAGQANLLGLTPLPVGLTDLLTQNHPYLLLGAISPDLPAISDFI